MELQNEIYDYKQDQVYLEVNKGASMAERKEANARLVGNYNMKVGMIGKNVTDLKESSDVKLQCT